MVTIYFLWRFGDLLVLVAHRCLGDDGVPISSEEILFLASRSREGFTKAQWQHGPLRPQMESQICFAEGKAMFRKMPILRRTDPAIPQHVYEACMRQQGFSFTKNAFWVRKRGDVAQGKADWPIRADVLAS